MDYLKSFEIYISAQKATGVQILAFGVVLLLAAILLHFNHLNGITQGLRNGFAVICILLIGSSVGFMLNQQKLYKTKSELHQSDQKEFKNQEVHRMQAVNKSVPKIILAVSAVVILFILIFMFHVKDVFWQGVILSILVYLLGLLILESISYISVKNYLELLLNE